MFKIDSIWTFTIILFSVFFRRFNLHRTDYKSITELRIYYILSHKLSYKVSHNYADIVYRPKSWNVYREVISYG